MKLLLKWIFVSLYFLSMLKPVIPFVEYELNKEYISEFLCINRDKPRLQCDGKCHLAQELREVNEQTNTEQNSKLPSLDMKEYPVSVLDNNEDIFATEYIQTALVYVAPEIGKTKCYSSSILRPPIQLV